MVAEGRKRMTFLERAFVRRGRPKDIIVAVVGAIWGFYFPLDSQSDWGPSNRFAECCCREDPDSRHERREFRWDYSRQNHAASPASDELGRANRGVWRPALQHLDSLGDTHHGRRFNHPIRPLVGLAQSERRALDSSHRSSVAVGMSRALRTAERRREIADAKR